MDIQYINQASNARSSEEVSDGISLASFLRSKGVDTTASSIRVNGVLTSDLAQELSDGAKVVVAAKGIKGAIKRFLTRLK